MALAGQVKVALSAQQCAAAARWLAGYRPPPPSLIGNPASQLVATVMGMNLAARFAKCARRNARLNSTRTLPRKLAEWFGQLLYSYISRAKVSALLLPPPLVVEVMGACLRATNLKRGRPRLVGTEAELAAQRLAYGNERHRRRLRRRAKYDRDFEHWVSGLTARGETLVTSCEPLPKI